MITDKFEGEYCGININRLITALSVTDSKESVSKEYIKSYGDTYLIDFMEKKQLNSKRQLLSDGVKGKDIDSRRDSMLI